MRKERKESPEASEREGFEDTHIVKFEQAIVLLGFSGSGGEEEVGSRERGCGMWAWFFFCKILSSCGVGMFFLLVWRKGVEMCGGRGRAWMRFWDKDFDRWEIAWGWARKWILILSLINGGVLSYVA